MAEYDEVLRQIKEALLGGDSLNGTGALINEVLQTMRGNGENTVRKAIQEMQLQIHRDLENLKNTSGVGGVGGVDSKKEGSEEKDFSKRMNDTIAAAFVDLKTNIHTDIEKIIEAQEIASQFGGGKGDKSSVPEFAAYMNRYMAISNIMDNKLRLEQDKSISSMSKLSDLFAAVTGKGGILFQQYQAQQMRAATGLVDLATKSMDLIAVFGTLGGYIKEMVSQGYQDFKKNRSVGLTGTQLLFDEAERTAKYGALHAGYSYAMTADQIGQNIAGGGISTNLIHGRNTGEMAREFTEYKEGINARGHDIASVLDAQEQLKLYQQTTSTAQQAGIFQGMRKDERLDMMEKSYTIYMDIAKSTGISAAKLIDIAKTNDDQLNQMRAMGALTGAQRELVSPRLVELETTAGKTYKDLAIQMIGAGGDIAQFYAKNQDAKMADVATNGALGRSLQSTYNTLLNPDKLSKDQLETAFASDRDAIPASSISQTVAYMSDQFSGAMKILGQIQPRQGLPTNIKGPPESDTAKNLLGKAESFGASFPIFSGAVIAFAGAVGTFAATVVSFMAAGWLSKLVGGGGAAALVGGTGAAVMADAGSIATRLISNLGSVASSIAKKAPLVGGAIAGGMDLYETGNVGHAATVGAGTGLGAWGGAAAGGAIGAFGGPAAPVTVPLGMLAGSIIGAIGGGIGSKYAADAVFPTPPPTISPITIEKLGSYASPLTGDQPPQIQGMLPSMREIGVAPPPTSIVGPATASASLSGRGEDTSLTPLLEISSYTKTSNDILAQIAMELTNQTGLLRQDNADSGDGGGYATPLPPRRIGDSKSDPGGPSTRVG